MQVRAEEFSHTVLHRNRGQGRGARPGAGRQVAAGGLVQHQHPPPLGVAGRALPPQPLPPKLKPPPPRVHQRPEDVYVAAGEAAKPAEKYVLVVPVPCTLVSVLLLQEEKCNSSTKTTPFQPSA